MRSPRRFLLLVILPGVPIGPSRTAVPASAPDDIYLPITEHTLRNGMRFLIAERHDSPTLVAYLRVQVGSVNERHRLTGLAHLLGHMMFKGTTPFGALDPERGLPILGKIDARYRVLLAEKAEGRLPGGTVDAAAVAALEGETAALEAEAGQSILPSELWEICRRSSGVRLNASTSREPTQYFVSLPSNPLELCALLESDRMPIPVFREFFRTHYAPNRVLAALVGDLDPAALIRTVERYFGSIPAQPIPPLLPLEEPPQTGSAASGSSSRQNHDCSCSAQAPPSATRTPTPRVSWDRSGRWPLVAIGQAGPAHHGPGIQRVSRRPPRHPIRLLWRHHGCRGSAGRQTIPPSRRHHHLQHRGSCDV